MRTTFIPNSSYRAAVNEDTLFVFDDMRNKMIMSIYPITASPEELAARNFDSIQEFQNVEIQGIIAKELQLESVNIEHLFLD